MTDLDTLVAPHSLDDFGRRYWSERSVLLSHNGARKPASVVPFDMRSFKEAARRAARGDLTAGQGAITADEMDACHRDGTTVEVRRAHLYDARLASFVTRLRRELGWVESIEAFAFWSPANAGLGWHLDTGNAFVVQLHGAKRWRFGVRPAVRFPPAPVVAEDARGYSDIYPWARLPLPEESETDEAVLHPGDVLYLPPGTWHTTSAADSDGSLGITIAVFGNPLHENLQRWIKETLGAKDDWRRPLDCWPTKGLESSNEATLRSRFDAFQQLAGSLTFEEFRSRCMGVQGELQPADRPALALPEQDTLLKLGGRLRFAPGEDDCGEPCFVVEAGRHNASMGIECLGFLEGLAQTKGPFRADAAVSWRAQDDTLSWEQIAPVLGGLLARNVLQRVSP